MNLKKKIAITGGPSGGKTTLIETLQRDFGHQVASVPEAATILYKGGFPRRKGSTRQIHIQRAIYFIQYELESIFEEERPNKLIICDRGSMDGLAYWPDSAENFFKSINSNPEKEYSRYDFVLHLDTAPEDSYDTENPIRTETYSEAIDVNTKILKAWEGHPQRIIIRHQTDFFGKMSLCIQIIRALLANESYEEIKRINQ